MHQSRMMCSEKPFFSNAAPRFYEICIFCFGAKNDMCFNNATDCREIFEYETCNLLLKEKYMAINVYHVRWIFKWLKHFQDDCKKTLKMMHTILKKSVIWSDLTELFVRLLKLPKNE